MSVELLRTDAFNDRLKFLKVRSGADRFREFRSPKMSGRRSRDDSIAHRHFENVFDFRRVLIAGNRAEAITGNPKIHMRRLNFYDLSKFAGRPIRFNPADDECLTLDRFRLVMLDRLEIAVAKLAERQLALRRIDLLPLF